MRETNQLLALESISSLAGPAIDKEFVAPEEIPFGQDIDDRYCMHIKLGHGGQASVWRSVDAHTGGPVALKIPHVQNEEHRERFVREAAVTAAMSTISKEVIGFVGAGVSEDAKGAFMYLATEYQEGGTLYDQIFAGKKGKVKTIRAIGTEALQKAMQPAAEGVVSIHEAGFLHRDIKPGNIFLDEEGRGKMGDLGLVAPEALDTEKFESYNIPTELVNLDSLTKTGRRLGTQFFAPYEVLAGEEGFTKAGDVWMTGVTITYCLSARHPYQVGEKMPETINEFVNTVETRRPLDLHEHDFSIPRELSTLALSCVERESKNRPTMHEVAATLSTI